MRIVRFDPAIAKPIQEFDSRAASALQVGEGTGEAHAFLLRFEQGGVIGPHLAGFGQLFAPLQGSGWIAGADGARRELRPGQAALVAYGEMHSKGSDTGMTAVMVQVQAFTPMDQ